MPPGRRSGLTHIESPRTEATRSNASKMPYSGIHTSLIQLIVPYFRRRRLAVFPRKSQRVRSRWAALLKSETSLHL
jgi:hypothetical protein